MISSIISLKIIIFLVTVNLVLENVAQQATVLLCDSIRKSFENAHLVGCLFLDSKAFDTMGHSIILEKLLLHGVNGHELLWLTDYLFNRTQTVEINNNSSTTENIQSGVPQGSILGPLLFIVSSMTSVIFCVSQMSYNMLMTLLFPFLPNRPT